MTAVAQDPSGNFLLAKNTAIHLVFASDVTSKNADVGDKLPLTLADDISFGQTILVPKGTPVEAIVTDADGSLVAGTPGTITFEVRSFKANGITVFLRGEATKEGQAKPLNAATLIPVVGSVMFFRHGDQAQIKQGTTFTAHVYADVLPPRQRTSQSPVTPAAAEHLPFRSICVSFWSMRQFLDEKTTNSLIDSSRL